MESEVIDRLLDEAEPSVRYLALTELLGERPDDPTVVAAREAIGHRGPAAEILSAQNEDGSWAEPERFYTAKYRGAVWQLIVLAELAADPRVAAGVDWLCTHLRFDDGDGVPHPRLKECISRHSCFMGVVKGLKGLAEIPEDDRSDAVRTCIAGGAEFLLLHHVYKRSQALDRVAKPGWTRFGFPLMYQTDVLEILLIMARLGYRDPRMDEAIALVASQRDEQGRWALRSSFNGKMWVDIERKGAPSRWITLRALCLERRLRWSTPGPDDA